MDNRVNPVVGMVETLYRYPVKSMFGESPQSLSVAARGIGGDRGWAVLDVESGKIASAKRPKLWGSLLLCVARTTEGEASSVEIEFPDGRIFDVRDAVAGRLLSEMTGREVRLISVPPDDPELDRAHPEEQLAAGTDADVESGILKLGAAVPLATFLDYAPVHLITTATLQGLTKIPGDFPEAIRYRPNVTIRSLPNAPAFPENHWVGGMVRIGDAVELRVVLETPRCAIPMLSHGTLPERPDALRAAVKFNRVDIAGFGIQPCAGVYVEVITAGVINCGDPVRFAPAQD